MKAFVAGLVIGLIAVPLFAFLYVYLGFAPVATAAPPFPLERKLASMALRARVNKDVAGITAEPANDQGLFAGAKLYREHCAVCHGLPGQPETPTAKGMYPPPPQLFHGHGVTDDPVTETYWKVTNGIRLTGMPAFGALSNTERWQVSQMLKNADKLPETAKALLAQPASAR
ncbi:MAG TPA: cytochrome c [Bryobacteraceae bacterium]|nr:cytochrome c [Bryobacteraceae bacterium]